MNRFFIATGVLCSLFLLGCGSKGPSTNMVEGTVLLDGSPVDGATIGFSPVSGGLPGTGITNAGGVFLLTAVQGGQSNQGVPEGEYKVTVSKLANIAPQPKPEELAQDDIWKKYPPEFKELIPGKYNDLATTDLTVTVSRGKNTPKLELKSK